ncbi:hypothetical protein SAMN02745150_01183 [Brevinema andersonii]|uniref:Uncharacterized protein n=1 Tax=Brevinema andersonii TaxID=34097 RepID=A0A1I1EMU2_BREAD|nr:hypothetical protein [Brevinema andersonii]SFB88415.1 hypothetical protein SAMN02745150_01183 [Brevinema andersonii]
MSIMVNGKQWDWGDITITLAPYTPMIFSAQSISYEETLEAEAVYGKGRMPIGYAKGNWSASGKLSILKTEFEVLALAIPSGILNLDPRNVLINVLYANAFDSIIPATTETLQGIRFTKISDNASQNDKGLSVELEFLILENILRNGKAARGKTLLS